MPDLVLNDTYIAWSWGAAVLFLLVLIALMLSIAALIKYLFFR